MVRGAKLPCPSLGQVNVEMVEEQLWFELGSPQGAVVLENAAVKKHIDKCIIFLL